MSFVRLSGSNGNTVELEAGMALRVAYVVRMVEADGGRLNLTEGLRPVGVPSDQYAKREQDTASGGSTQWFQWGRYQRYLQGDRTGTPSAAYPGTSRHGLGLAIDWDAPTTRDMQLRAKHMPAAGLVANVASETWHAEGLRAPTVNLDPPKDGFPMLNDAEQKELLALAKAIREGQLASHKKWTLDQEIANSLKTLISEIQGLRAELKK